MNSLILKQNIYGILRKNINQCYKYEENQFIKFLEYGDYGFSLDGLSAWRDYLITKGYKARTVNKYLLVAKSSFKRVFQANKAEITEAQREKVEQAFSEIKKIKEPRCSDICAKVLSEDEIKAFLDKCEKHNPEIALMFEFMYRTGVRVSEMLNIKHSDLKYIGNKIYQIRVLGKGSRERSVYCEQDFIKLVKDFFKSSTYLFKIKSRKRSRSYVSMFIKRYCVRFIDRHNISAHILRHTFCTNSLERGLSLEHVRIMAGHSDIQTTARFYSHVVVKPAQFVSVAKIKRERCFKT